MRVQAHQNDDVLRRLARLSQQQGSSDRAKTEPVSVHTSQLRLGVIQGPGDQTVCQRGGAGWHGALAVVHALHLAATVVGRADRPLVSTVDSQEHAPGAAAPFV